MSYTHSMKKPKMFLRWATLILITIVCVGCRSKGTANHDHHLKTLGEDTYPLPLSQAPSGTVLLSWPSLFQALGVSPQQGSTGHIYCSGTHIKPGVVITAKHCLTPKLLGLPLPLPKLLIIFSATKKLLLSTSSQTIISHPEEDLALLFFDPKQLPNPPPSTAELFTPTQGEHQELYQQASFYGLGGTGFHPDYPKKPIPGSLMLHGSQQLYVLSTHKKSRRFLTQHLPPAKEWQQNPMDENLLHKLFLDEAAFDHKSYLLASAYLRLQPLPKSPELKEVLFCGGDSGGGLRDAHGKLMGVLSTTPWMPFSRSIRSEETTRKTDLLAHLMMCGRIGTFVDLWAHHAWIQEQLSEYTVSK